MGDAREIAERIVNTNIQVPNNSTGLRVLSSDAIIRDIEAALLAERARFGQSALELCWEIEKLPASEQQTKISIMASSLAAAIRKESDGSEKMKTRTL